MSDLLILGTDTDAGKTTFALLWLAQFSKQYDYWKPLETGDSDSERIRSWTKATVHAPMMRLKNPVAPLLAAREEGKVIPGADEILRHKPKTVSDRRLLVETFGSPFSPLNETELQVTLIQQLRVPSILIASSKVGAVGRSLQCLQALQAHGIHPEAVVLIGKPDDFAVAQIRQYAPRQRVFQLSPPAFWNATGIEKSAAKQQAVLCELRDSLPTQTTSPTEPELLALDRKAVWHPYTALRDPDPPLLCVGARDEFLHLSDGWQVIDGISSWWTVLHGHRTPFLMAALHRALEQFDHVHFAGVTHPPAIRLAQLLLNSGPWPDGRVFFSDNGSTSVEVALKMAYQYWCRRGEPGRTLFIGFQNGYHGDTFGAMAAGRDPVFFGQFEPLLFETEIIPVSADRLRETLTRRRGRTAAVILEPLVQAAGGMHFHSHGELNDIFKVTREFDVLFIADEVMTGCCRLGPLWAHRTANIAPDLTCVAKTLAGGILSLAATIAAPHIVSAFDTDDRRHMFFHGHSFTAHPLACAVAGENLRELIQRPPDAPQRFQQFWKRSLEPMRGLRGVQDVRYLGTLGVVELDVPGGYLADIGRRLRTRCLELGVLLRPLGNVLYAMPPFCTSERSLETIAEAMKESVSAVAGKCPP